MRSSTVLAVKLQKCSHCPEKTVMTAVNNDTLIEDIFWRYHDDRKKTISFVARGKTSLETSVSFELSQGLTVSDLVNFGVKCIEFTCNGDDDHDSLYCKYRKAADEATQKATDAFQVLMAKGKGFPKKKTNRYNITVIE